MGSYILALDQGTSSSRAIVFNEKAEIISKVQKEFSQIYPKAGWVEQDPMEIWESQLTVAKMAIEEANINASDILAIGITNQRETAIIWDKNTGAPIYNAIVWQDKRTANYCEELKNKGLEDYIRTNTGLIADSYFSGTKIRWILDNVEGAREKAENGDIIFGTVDTWLIYNLTAGQLHITDYSNASRTLIFNIKNLDWDKKMLKELHIPEAILPKVEPSSKVYGNTNKTIFGVEIPIAGIAGDQQAALFGQTCFKPGMAKNTYGTGCFMLMNTGEKMVKSKHGLLTTIAWNIDGKTEYALEGSIFIAGAAVKWLRDSLHLIDHTIKTSDMANELESSEGVYFVPAFSGLGAPYWDMYARGAILGLTQGCTDKHIVRATLESLAYQSKDIINVMEKDSGIKLKTLNVDGGASVNDFLMQFQADILNSQVIRPANIETTALGAAFLAGIAVGLWKQDSIFDYYQVDQYYLPSMEEETRKELYDGWLKAIDRTRNWIDN